MDDKDGSDLFVELEARLSKAAWLCGGVRFSLHVNVAPLSCARITTSPHSAQPPPRFLRRRPRLPTSWPTTSYPRSARRRLRQVHPFSALYNFLPRPQPTFLLPRCVPRAADPPALLSLPLFAVAKWYTAAGGTPGFAEGQLVAKPVPSAGAAAGAAAEEEASKPERILTAEDVRACPGLSTTSQARSHAPS